MTSKATLLIGTALALLFSGSVAMAADLYVPPAAAAAAPVVSTNWDGPYIGASVGYGWGSANSSYTRIGFGTTGTSAASPTGWLVGAQAGYNFHVADSLVMGLEGNIDWVNESGDFAPGTGSQSINWEDSIRGRLGYDAGQFLPYVEAGVAFANSTAHGTSVSISNNHVGWTVGGGVEFMLADHLSANVEYRYSDYGTQTYTTTGYNNNIRLTDSTVRVGLNYHF